MKIALLMFDFIWSQANLFLPKGHLLQAVVLSYLQNALKLTLSDMFLKQSTFGVDFKSGFSFHICFQIDF